MEFPIYFYSSKFNLLFKSIHLRIHECPAIFTSWVAPGMPFHEDNAGNLGGAGANVDRDAGDNGAIVLLVVHVLDDLVDTRRVDSDLGDSGLGDIGLVDSGLVENVGDLGLVKNLISV